MGKFNTIDDFINTIVMKFGNDELIQKELKKLALLNESKNFVIEDNKVKSKVQNKNGENFVQTIELDIDNNKIVVIEEGTKKEEDSKKEFVHTFVYSVDDSKKTMFECDEDREIIYNPDNTILDKFVTRDSYNYYDNDKLLGSSTICNEKSALLGYNNFIIEENEIKFKQIVYVLPTLDRVKYQDNNGDVKYLFSSKNESIGDIIYREITKEDFDRLIENSDDLFKIINDDVVYETKKINY